ncbi:ComEC/Rec2 family competence protein [Corynebacterium antarcticum]|uniref:ComEC/Rec2 family competence protein n=1 Tax=Corynebacterium antarcticum TaxID=2800405 RepID=UPI002260C721|nr:ComEC/Rec2 family competence protein [Corynebacterium antarcticum]MCX7539216.1 ComEC/Rec2 family competence protein [Corynebacterium antarcticum]
MTELRLLPSAVVVWMAVAVVLMTRTTPAGIVPVAAGALIAAAVRAPGQGLLITGCGAAAVVTSRIRVAAADRHPLNAVARATVEGRVVAAPESVGDGVRLLRLRVDGYPADLPVFVRDPDAAVGTAGSVVRVTADVGPGNRPGVGTLVLDAHSITRLREPEGMQRLAGHVRAALVDATSRWLDPDSAGLVSGMVLGDTGGQSEEQRRLYLDTGLSHLSAVSGSNVAIVTTAVFLLARALGLGPRVQVAGAVVALLGFVSLVGTEPSVLRAAATGMVGLVAVVASTRAEPVHALCLAVIVLLCWRSDLAVEYGFALSVAATAGIVALHPLFHRPLAATGWPAVVIRAVSVAIAADVVTMPIIAVMAGRISLVSVAANVLAAPAVAPVTVLGLVAAALAVVPGIGEDLAGLPLILIAPCARWITGVARLLASLPLSTVPVADGWLGVAWVILGCCWIVWAVCAGRVRILVGVAVAAAVLGALSGPHPTAYPPAPGWRDPGLWHDGARETVTTRPRAPDPR